MDRSKIKGNLKKLRKPATLIAVAGAACVTAHFGGDLKIIPEAMKILDDGDAVRILCDRSTKTKPNPIMLVHGEFKGYADAASPVTLNYLGSRRLKKIGGALVSITGTASSAASGGHNIPGAIREGTAVTTTAMHMAKLGAIGVAHLKDEDVQAWITKIEGMKGAKAAVRGGKLAGAIVPGASAFASIAAEIAKLGIELSKETMCHALGCEIHYAAYFERKLAKGEGPATDIVRELFTKRGVTRLLGSYNVDAMIDEPAGWMAIADKIGLI